MDPASGSDNGVNQMGGAAPAPMGPMTLPSLPTGQEASASATAAPIPAAAATSAAPAPAAPAVPAPAQGVSIPVTPRMTDLASAIVDDGDLIEKEWVGRAKHIVAGTRSDPYKQSQQLAALRAEYMKKRYGKDIKLGE